MVFEVILKKYITMLPNIMDIYTKNGWNIWQVFNIDDKMEWLHYYTHYIKFGIGRTRFDVSQEIRSGHITRDEGIRLCKKFEGEYPKRYINDCFSFMKLTELEANNIIDKFEHHIFGKKQKDGKDYKN